MNYAKKFKLILSMDKLWFFIYAVLNVIFAVFISLNAGKYNVISFIVPAGIGIQCVIFQMTVPFSYMRSLRVTHLNLHDTVELSMYSSDLMCLISMVILSIQAIITQNYDRIIYICSLELIFMLMGYIMAGVLAKDKSLMKKSSRYGFDKEAEKLFDLENDEIEPRVKLNFYSSTVQIFCAIVINIALFIVYGIGESGTWQLTILKGFGFAAFGITIAMRTIYSRKTDMVYLEN